MNTTKVESFAVDSIAWRVSLSVRRCRAIAITSAPVAPIAPPSVGVAQPRKMVPSTRKMSASGGIRTKITCSASFESRPRRAVRFTSAAAKARAAPAPAATTSRSSSAASGYFST